MMRLKGIYPVILIFAVVTLFVPFYLKCNRISNDEMKIRGAFSTYIKFKNTINQLRLYEEEHGHWPADPPSLGLEFLSSPNGNAEIHSTFDGTGGWVYDPEKKRFYVNLQGTVRDILGVHGDREDFPGRLLKSTPCEWDYDNSFFEKDAPRSP